MPGFPAHLMGIKKDEPFIDLQHCAQVSDPLFTQTQQMRHIGHFGSQSHCHGQNTHSLLSKHAKYSICKPAQLQKSITSHIRK